MARSMHLAVAVGDPVLETALHETLEAAGCHSTRCLAAADLLTCLRAGGLDAALVGSALYQLDTERWHALRSSGVPLVLRADPAEAARFPGAVARFAQEASVAALVQALLEAATGRSAQAVAAPPVSQPAMATGASPPSAAPAAGGRVLVVSGAAGAGRTTLAANLALALGLVAPTVAVDADLQCPALAPALDGDVTRNLAALAHADPDQPAAWDRALAREGQPLHARCPQGVLLCGLPKPEQRAAISRAFAERLLAALRERFAYVLLDAGSDVLIPDSGLHRAALLAADDLLVVVRADPLGVAAARSVLGLWERQLQLPEERMALVVSGYDRRCHPTPATIAWHLHLPVAAVLPEEHVTLHQAQLRRQPALFTGGRYAAALLAFADRLCGGELRLPEEIRLRRRGLRWPFHLPQRQPEMKGGQPHDDDAVPVT
jgi:septum formation inhibitor-activating ATPase MinD